MAYTQEELNMLNSMFSTPSWELFRERTIRPLISQATEEMAYKPGKNISDPDYVFWSSIYYVMNLLTKTPSTVLSQIQEYNKQISRDSDHVEWS